MALRVYNTLTRQKEDFVPLGETVKMYVCGPNLYGPCHVGHALSYIVFDAIRRYLEHSGYAVRHVQNFTDIEDRIIVAAQTQNTTVTELAELHIARFLQEMDALNILRAHVYPRATRVIPKMQEVIQGLIAKGHAYVLENGDIYFRVTSHPSYGALSSRSLDEMQAGARIEPDPRKEHPMDFALWKAAKPGEPNWPSPWGPGRPGWHIECSAMSMQYLGEQLDIHGGGHDVIFPHHENEIAQSESFTGKVPFVKYWLHNALLRLSGDEEKMTRHLGNIVSVREALERYNPDAIRLFVLSSHYRSPVAWSDEGVQAADKGVERLRAAVRESEVAGKSASPVLQQAVEEARHAFAEAMDDDFNTPQAIAVLFDLARETNRARDEGFAVSEGLAALRELAGVLGLTLQERPAQLEAKPFVDLLVAVRGDLRAAKQWALTDRIRSGLKELGVTLEDSAQGTTWKAK
jgi:cysteinyl-tRNA synthetase